MFPPFIESIIPIARRPSIQTANQDARDAERTYSRHENFRAYAVALGLFVILVAVIVIQWSEVQTKTLFTVSFLVYSILGIGNASIERGNPRYVNFYLAIQALLVILMSVPNPVMTIMFFYPLSVQAILKIRIRPGLIWTGLFAFITVAVYWYSGERMDNTFSFNSIVACGGFFFFGMLGSVLVRMRQNEAEIRHLLLDLGHANSQLQQYAKQTKSLATAAERDRLAKELHDTLGHRLTVSIAQLDGASLLVEQDGRQANRMLKTARTQLNAGLDELRHVLNALHNTDLKSDSLVDSLQQIVNEFASVTDVVFHIQMPDKLPPLSDAQCLAVYRTVQEALTNTQKHAEASNIWIVLDVSDDALTLSVRNDGRNIDPSRSSGIGIQGMKGRAAQLGGAVRVTKPAEGGALVTFSLPLREMTAEYV